MDVFETHLPLYEAKTFLHFDDRFGTYEGQTDSQANQGKLPELDEAQHADPAGVSLPWYWVPAEKANDRLQVKWNRDWLLGWRDVCRNTDTRTLIASFIPKAKVGDKFLLMFPNAIKPAKPLACSAPELAGFGLLRHGKRLAGRALKYFIIRQLPVLPSSTYRDNAHRSFAPNLGEWVASRVLELTYTAWELAPCAHDC